MRYAKTPNYALDAEWEEMERYGETAEDYRDNEPDAFGIEITEDMAYEIAEVQRHERPTIRFRTHHTAGMIFDERRR